MKKAEKAKRAETPLPFLPCETFLPLYQFRLHFLECLDELWEIFDVEHDRRLLTTAALLADLEELAVTRLFEVDVERALASVDGDAVHIIRKVAASAASARWTWGAWS